MSYDPFITRNLTVVIEMQILPLYADDKIINPTAQTVQNGRSIDLNCDMHVVSEWKFNPQLYKDKFFSLHALRDTRTFNQGKTISLKYISMEYEGIYFCIGRRVLNESFTFAATKVTVRKLILIRW